MFISLPANAFVSKYVWIKVGDPTPNSRDTSDQTLELKMDPDNFTCTVIFMSNAPSTEHYHQLKVHCSCTSMHSTRWSVNSLTLTFVTSKSHLARRCSPSSLKLSYKLSEPVSRKRFRGLRSPYIQWASPSITHCLNLWGIQPRDFKELLISEAETVQSGRHDMSTSIRISRHS